jgi:hypothetical protein
MKIIAQVAVKKHIKGVAYKYWNGSGWSFEPCFFPQRSIEFQFECATSGLSEQDVEKIRLEVKVCGIESSNQRVLEAYKD